MEEDILILKTDEAGFERLKEKTKMIIFEKKDSRSLLYFFKEGYDMERIMEERNNAASVGDGGLPF